MFARVLDFHVKAEKKDEFVKTLKNQVVPILKKHNGFQEILPLIPENMKEEKVRTISLWATKADAERYNRDTYNKVFDILKPFITSMVEVKYYDLETTVCERFVEALAA